MCAATPVSKRGTQKRDAWMVATGLAAGLLIWFALANSEQVEIHFWVVSAKAPLIVVIVVSALLGALILTLWRRSRRHPHSS